MTTVSSRYARRLLDACRAGDFVLLEKELDYVQWETRAMGETPAEAERLELLKCVAQQMRTSLNQLQSAQEHCHNEMDMAVRLLRHLARNSLASSQEY